MSKLLNGFTVFVVIAASLMFFFTYTESRPYKMTRTLPELEADKVLEVIMDYSSDSCSSSSFDGDLEALVLWFNQAKELKTEVGTTSDCRMTLRLEGGSEIYIWNMNNHHMVTVGYKNKESYYQTNVYSGELGEYLNDFREKMVAQQEQGAWAY